MVQDGGSTRLATQMLGGCDREVMILPFTGGGHRVLCFSYFAPGGDGISGAVQNWLDNKLARSVSATTPNTNYAMPHVKNEAERHS